MGSPCSRVEKAPTQRTVKHKTKSVPINLATIPKLNKGHFEHEYQAGKTIAQKVSEVKNKITSRIYVDYKLQKSTFPCNDPLEILGTLQKLQQIEHPNICKMIEAFDDRGCIHIIYNHTHGLPLLEHIDKTKHMSERKASDIGRQLVRALACGEKIGIAHGALVPKNIFVSKSGEDVVITDFGLVDCVKPDTVHRMDMDSLAFTAPEILKPWYESVIEAEAKAARAGKAKSGIDMSLIAERLPPVRKTSASDLFSVGSILFLLMTGKAPFKGRDSVELARRVLETEADMTYMKKKVSQEAKDFLRSLLAKDLSSRPSSASKLMSSDWLAKPEKTISDEELDEGIFRELGTLQKETRFKKFIMKMVASSLPCGKVQNLKDAFHQADIDGDGFISLDEMHKFVKNYPDIAASWEHDLESIFNEIDVGGEGYISLPEFIAATLDSQEVLVRATLWDAFRAIDANKDGKLSSAELKRVVSEVDGTLGSVHVDSLTQILQVEVGGKEITFEEFLNLISEEGGRQNTDARGCISCS